MRWALLILLATLAAPASAAPPRAFAAEVMATRIEARFAGPTGTQADADVVFDVFVGVDLLASEWKEGSALTAVNAAAGRAVAVPPELMRLLQRAVDIAQTTGGAFDPTWAALWGLWDFRAAAPRPPAEEDRLRRVALVDWRGLTLDAVAGTAALERPGMVVGLGGIAKGWALDLAVSALRARGVTDFVLSAGGQVWAEGNADGGRPWNVGIRDPRGAVDDYFAVVAVSGASVSTSGDYERWFAHDGVRYHHILDPRTGLPGRLFRSVTVIAEDATTADALSTALMLMPLEAGRRVAAESRAEVVWVDADGGVHRTDGLGSRYVVRHPPLPDGPP